jgi:hypothetical protein
MIGMVIASSAIVLIEVAELAMSPEALAKLVYLHVQGDGVIGQVNNKEVTACLPKWPFFGVNILIGLWWSISGIRFDLPINDKDLVSLLDPVGRIVGMIASLVLIHYLYIWAQLFLPGLVKQIIRMATKPINDAYQKHQLRNLDSQTAAYAETFGISWPSAGDAVALYLMANVSRIFQAKRKLADAIEGILSQARSDLQHLNAACKQRDMFIANYDRVAFAGNRTGQVPLIRELDELYRGVHSENVMGLLVARRWTEYDEIMHDIQADLGRIEQLTKQVEDEDNRGGRSTGSEYTVEWALNVLGLEHSATNDQIKDVRNRLAMIYHTDVGHVNGDGKIKEINRAYALLKKDRDFV